MQVSSCSWPLRVASSQCVAICLHRLQLSSALHTLSLQGHECFPCLRNMQNPGNEGVRFALCEDACSCADEAGTVNVSLYAQYAGPKQMLLACMRPARRRWRT